MQKKQQTRHGSEPVNIMATILQSIPKEAAVTKIEYEGPRIALYTNSPKFLLENHTIISKLVGMIKKRIVVRTDQSIRMSFGAVLLIYTATWDATADHTGEYYDGILQALPCLAHAS